ncbi:hypothetical protein EYF80_017504 [Liparis tanakae]|uniref:Uncharacterized protein n=1 Tax=Liparis tanakae TaxID=230148 RepID=A0A4Z2I317_9TELE|nr:hypothetical protein EYF80_017504 [Liparis tanakae]
MKHLPSIRLARLSVASLPLKSRGGRPRRSSRYPSLCRLRRIGLENFLHPVLIQRSVIERGQRATDGPFVGGNIKLSQSDPSYRLRCQRAATQGCYLYSQDSVQRGTELWKCAAQQTCHLSRYTGVFDDTPLLSHQCREVYGEPPKIRRHNGGRFSQANLHNAPRGSRSSDYMITHGTMADAFMMSFGAFLLNDAARSNNNSFGVQTVTTDLESLSCSRRHMAQKPIMITMVITLESRRISLDQSRVLFTSVSDHGSSHIVLQQTAQYCLGSSRECHQKMLVYPDAFH